MRDGFVKVTEAVHRVLVPDFREEPDFSDELITPEEFELELVELGLSGNFFGPADYAERLGHRLELQIATELMNDIHHPAFRRRLALSGRLAETHYFEDRQTALILLPASLGPMLLALSALHELSHLAAGDHLIGGKPGKRLARSEPLSSEDLREKAADLRAYYALLAGTLGPRNPYACELYEVP